MSEQVKIDLLLDKDLADWLDEIKDQLALRSTSSLLNKLLRELKDESQ